MNDRDQAGEPDSFDAHVSELGGFRGVVVPDGAVPGAVVDMTSTIETVSEPPLEPAQPPSPPEAGSSDSQ